MSERIGGAASVPSAPPRWVFSLFNPIVKFLMSAGVPLGPNGLITVRGRKSGLSRTTPVAIIEGIEAAYGARLKRLRAIKDSYDPTNLFRMNANIRPSQRP